MSRVKEGFHHLISAGLIGATAFTASACTKEPVSLLQNYEGDYGSVTSLGPTLGLTAGHVSGCTEGLVDTPLLLRDQIPLRVVWKDCSLDVAIVMTGPEFSIPVIRFRDAETLQYGEEITLNGYPARGGVKIVRPLLHPYYEDVFPPYLMPFSSPNQQPERQKWQGRFVGLIEIEAPEFQDGFQELVVVAIHRPSGYIVQGMSGGVIEDAAGNYVSLINFWALPGITGDFPPAIQEQFETLPNEELVAGVRVDHILRQFGQANQSSPQTESPPPVAVPCLSTSC